MTLTDFLLQRIAEDEAWADASMWQVAFPRSPLAECEAKRRIVSEHREQAGGGCDVCSRHEYPCPTLRFLALPYADHPDYRDEWRP